MEIVNLSRITIVAIIFFSCQSGNRSNFHTWAPTPPMGWNSWDCYGPTVEEHEVKANADYMAENLKEYGWEYIVVDIRWFVENDKAGGYNQTDPRYVMDEYGRYLPAENRFPSAENGQGFKPLADYIHDKGLKFGIHIMRGIPVQAVNQKLPIKGTEGITADQIYSTELQCLWLRDNYTIVADSVGAQEYYNSIMDLYASWGVDFIKIDDLSRPYHKAEIELIRKAIDQTGRSMVLSTSPGATPLEYADHVQNHANMWRLVDDVWDTWPHISHLLDVCEDWYPYIGDGTWPDCDMLPLGRISIRGERGDERMTRLTQEEQYSLLSLWAIFRSPLMFGGDLPSNDAFTLGLLTNREVLDVVNHSKNNRLLSSNGPKKIWIAEDSKSDDIYAALFYDSGEPEIQVADAVFSTPLITYKEGEQSTHVNVDLGNSNKLYLVVTNGGDNNAWDHADWIEPKLSGPKGTISLTDLEWVKATSGWESAVKSKSVAGGKLILEDMEYNDGIGTHSNSIIEYDIPEGYDTFSSLVGLDKFCIEHTEGATVNFHVFTKNPLGEDPADSISIDLNFADLGLEGAYDVRDLWAKKDIGRFTEGISFNLKDHGSKLVRISKAD